MSVARTDPDTAIRELTALLAEDPGLLMARRTRAVAYEAAGQYEAAIRDLRALEKAGQLTAEDASCSATTSASRACRGSGGGARAHGAEEPEVRPALALPGRALVEAEPDGGGRGAYEHVLALAPDHIEALRGLGDLALLRGRRR